MKDLNKTEKLTIAARYWLLGMAEADPRYFKVLEAMELAIDHHDGKRNGGDPEIVHQLGMFHHARTLHKHFSNPWMVYTLIFLHDAVEDANQKTGKFITLHDIENCFGMFVRDKVHTMSKNILGAKNTSYSLEDVFSDEDCSTVKGFDRVNNVSSMVGVFKKERLLRYVQETTDEFLPQLKLARRKFPHQEAIYENIKLELVNQLSLISHIVDGQDQSSV